MAMILIDKKEIEENGVIYIVETYKSDKTGKESVVKYPKSKPDEEVIPEPSQLDRIEEMVSKSAEELRQEGAEALTLELIEGGIL